MNKIPLDTPVEHINFPNRCISAFRDNNVKTLRDIVLRHMSDVKFLKGVGNKTLADIEATLSQYGLRISMTADEVAEYESDNHGVNDCKHKPFLYDFAGMVKGFQDLGLEVDSVVIRFEVNKPQGTQADCNEEIK